MTADGNAEQPYTVRYEGDRRLIEHKVMTTDAGEVTIQHDFPDALAHHYAPGDVNEAILLYRGHFDVVGDDGDPFDGYVAFEWQPNPRIRARGERDLHLAHEFMQGMLDGPGAVWVEMPQVTIPLEGALPPQPSEAAPEWTKRPGSAYMDDRLAPQRHGDDKDLDRVTFLIPNGWIGHDGTGICDPSFPVHTWYGRIQVTHGDWEITVDQRKGLGDVSFARSLKQSGGHYITHTGQIRRTDGASFDIEQIEWILETLRLSFTLACGRTINLVLPVGWSGDAAVWSDWTARPVDPYRTVSTWRDESIANAQVGRLVECMLDYCQDADRREVVRYAISYYVTANFDLDVELMVAVPVSGLQLLAYFRLVEEDAKYSPGDFKKFTTEEQIRHLLDSCAIDTSIPSHYHELAAVAASIPLDKAGDPTPDALRSVVYLRNKIIHPTKQKPGNWDVYRWAEASFVSRHFLVMAILNTVGYDGHHHSMISAMRWLGSTTPVPWAQPAPTVTP